MMYSTEHTKLVSPLLGCVARCVLVNPSLCLLALAAALLCACERSVPVATVPDAALGPIELLQAGGTWVDLSHDFGADTLYWPTAEGYLGTAERGPDAVADLHFPGIAAELAAWLVSDRQVAAVGIDTASIDYGQSTLFETHRTLFEHDIPGFENVANLDSLPATGAMVVALLMKIKGGSGGRYALSPGCPRQSE
jgi:hypothetical protein